MIKSAKYAVKLAVERMPKPIREFYDHLHDREFVKQVHRRTVSEMEGCFRRFVSDYAPLNPLRTELMAALAQVGLTEALYIIDNLHRSLAIEGDVCEFGVAQGATSALIANEIRDFEKTLWLYDSFKGLPEPSEQDVLIHDVANLGEMHKYKGMIAHPAAAVRRRLARISFPEKRSKIVPGWVEDLTRTDNLPEKVCFAYVDLDLYIPIKTVLTLLNSRLPPGACVVIDDYGFFSAGAQTAVDQFVADHKQGYRLEVPLRFSEDQDHFAIMRKL